MLGPGATQSWWPVLARRALPALLLAIALVLAFRARSHRRRVAAAALVLLGSTLLSWLLKALLMRPEYGVAGYPDNSFPSTHASATMALIAAVLLLAPQHPPWVDRGLAAAGVVVVIGNVVGHAHRPSDVIGSLLLVGLVTGAVRATGARFEGGRRRRAAPEPIA